MAEPTLEEMPLLEYTLKRYAYNLAKRLGIPTDMVDEKWDVIVDRKLTYHENKARVKEYLLNLARPEKRFESKEYMAELERQEDEEIHRQLEYLIYTVRDILEGNTYSDYYRIAEETGLLDEPISRWIKELEDWKNMVVKRTYVKKFKTLVGDLMNLELRLSAYKVRHGDVPMRELVGKWDELFENLAKSKIELEEEEIELKPIYVKKGRQERLKYAERREEEAKPEVKAEVKRKKSIEELTESEAVKYFEELNAKIKSALKLPLRERYEKLKELADEVKSIVESPAYSTSFEAQAVAYYYKQAVWPLATFFGEKGKFMWLGKVKTPIKVVAVV